MESVKLPLKVRRQLGVELRGARTLAGLTQRDLAAQIEANQPRVMRAERAETLLTKAEVLAWLTAVEADQAVRDRVLALTDAAHTETWAWQGGMSDGHLQGIAADDEVAAVRVRNYAMQWMPGLVQTGAYARALLTQVDPTGDMNVPAAVAARLERQGILFEDGRRFELMFEEASLLWSPEAGVMRAQLDRLLSVATLDAVRFSVVEPRNAQAGASEPLAGLLPKISTV